MEWSQLVSPDHLEDRLFYRELAWQYDGDDLEVLDFGQHTTPPITRHLPCCPWGNGRLSSLYIELVKDDA